MIPLLAPILGIVDKAVDRLVPDNAASQRIKDEIGRDVAMASVKGELGQIEVNKIEAASASVFTSGWRPFIGWVCGAALAFEYVASPLAVWIAASIGHPIPPPPKLDEVLWQLMFGILGMGSLRTFEKVRGVASK